MHIETDVPLPVKWLFSDMKPGNSFLVAEANDDWLIRTRARRNAWSAAKRYMAKHPNIKLTVRVDRAHNIRCWRVE